MKLNLTQTFTTHKTLHFFQIIQNYFKWYLIADVHSILYKVEEERIYMHYNNPMMKCVEIVVFRGPGCLQEML